MPSLADLSKRLFVGRPLRSDRLGETLLSKKIALPVFASDALSSVSYAPQEIFATLSIAGIAAYSYAPWVAAAVVVILLTVVASYRQNVHAYPSGGGDYEVATVNLGPVAGLTVASALLVDYVLTVAVSVSAGVDNIASAVPLLDDHRVAAALLLVAVLAFMNLRGVRESGTTFAVPTYGFMIGVFVMLLWAGVRLAAGADLRAESAPYQVVAEQSHLVGFALVFLVLRAFSSGCAALTGVEAISNGVPAFRPPKSKNAASTLLTLGLIAVTMFSGVVALAMATGVRLVEHPDRDLIGSPPGYQQKTVIAQVAEVVFSNFPPAFFYLATVTGLILVLAANTAFNGFPVLGSILAQDRYLPRQLHTRGDRLAYSNGIVLLAGFAGLLIYVFRAQVSALIQLYIIGVFVSFTLSQTGMVRHWTRLLRRETDPAARAHMLRSRVINTVGLCLTGTVLVIVLVTKFAKGAWIVCVATPVIFLTMKAIRRHYDNVSIELAAGEDPQLLPSRNHAVVLVSRLHRPTLRALAYARATRPSTLVAVTVNVDDRDTQALQEEWERRGIPIDLLVLDSPYREVTRPVLDYVAGIRRRSPRDVVTVFVPEYVVGRWWEHLLHNQSALRLKARLLFQPGVMMVSVPYQLRSSARASERPERGSPGELRRLGESRAGVAWPDGRGSAAVGSAADSPGSAERPAGRPG